MMTHGSSIVMLQQRLPKCNPWTTNGSRDSFRWSAE